MLSRGELRSRPVPVFKPGTRHCRDPSPPWSCRIASFRLWPLAIIPQKHNVRRQTSGVNRQNSAHTSQKKKRVALPLSRLAQRPTPMGTASRIMLLLCIPRWPLFRWAPGTRSALTVQGLTRPVRERRSQGEGRTPRTVSTRSTPRSAAPGLLTRTPPTRCAFR